MRGINTIPEREFMERLFKSMQRMRKKISRLSDEEDSLYRKAIDNDDEEEALKHWFNSAALFWAGQATVIALGKLKERLKEINMREFTPTLRNESKNIK